MAYAAPIRPPEDDMLPGRSRCTIPRKSNDRGAFSALFEDMLRRRARRHLSVPQRDGLYHGLITMAKTRGDWERLADHLCRTGDVRRTVQEAFQERCGERDLVRRVAWTAARQLITNPGGTKEVTRSRQIAGWLKILDLSETEKELRELYEELQKHIEGDRVPDVVIRRVAAACGDRGFFQLELDVEELLD